MKIAVIGDLHWGARNDNQEFLNYFQRFFDNVFFPELEERGVNKILQVGDFVDRRKFICLCRCCGSQKSFLTTWCRRFSCLTRYV